MTPAVLSAPAHSSTRSPRRGDVDWTLLPAPRHGRRVAVPRTMPRAPIPPHIDRSEIFGAPHLRLSPVDPLHRRDEDRLTARGWKPQPTTAPLPHPYPWAYTMVQVIFEVLDGTRSCAQLARWLAPDLYEALRERERLTATRAPRTPQRIRTRSLRLQVAQARADFVACECIGVVDVGERSRAICLRAESYHSRWRITALEIG
ncbi:hypothetical protein H8R18_01910 [Nanchangia anserum]|uniref:Uncharacterized protein n=1 Tax=Nanchangia anserum TaxID=2692125 RepID=A0A8I0KP77_9ACTO|nr:Rv3235 family protein [Nanchangia anserum]MBD3690066.1 hypothetical protein [Nanchangia anserum]QOX82141.1 hypothetical protein H8R18_01910 [Nanchangia anserum]